MFQHLLQYQFAIEELGKEVKGKYKIDVFVQQKEEEK